MRCYVGFARGFPLAFLVCRYILRWSKGLDWRLFSGRGCPVHRCSSCFLTGIDMPDCFTVRTLAEPTPRRIDRVTPTSLVLRHAEAAGSRKISSNGLFILRCARRGRSCRGSGPQNNRCSAAPTTWTRADSSMWRGSTTGQKGPQHVSSAAGESPAPRLTNGLAGTSQAGRGWSMAV